jgi:DNA-binding response OmpR family regulator
MANILVVDDERNVVELVAFLLEKEGHQVRTVGDGQACLDAVAADKPDLIVLDVMLPILDGYTVCTRLAEDDVTRSIPIIMLTAKGQMRDVFTMSSNVAAYLDKPFDPSDLRARVMKALSHKS